MANWKKNDWKNSTGKPVVNREELEELDKAQEGIQVSYVSALSCPSYVFILSLWPSGIGSRLGRNGL